VPVDLRALPEQITLSPPPRKGRWCLFTLLCLLLGASLVVLLWPADLQRMTLWFWCCAVIFPVVCGLLLFAFRLLAYERQQQFAQSWNQSRAEQAQALIQHGQRAIAVLATSYCTPAGIAQLARALRNGIKPLQPVYLKQWLTTLRLSQLVPETQNHSKKDYERRLAKLLEQVFVGFGGELQRFAGLAPLRLRIRHNQVLSDAEILSLWRACSTDQMVPDHVVFAEGDGADGLLWLDSWLDEPEPFALALSLEINVFQAPVADQAESVSAVLLAPSEFCTRHQLAPMAWVHRPVLMTTETTALQDALLWGRVDERCKPCFVWRTQVPRNLFNDVRRAMTVAEHPVDIDSMQVLDDSFGLPASAVGNISLIVASEQAASDRKPQLVMLQDQSAQWCVVQPTV
jgi:hypothetical protein